MDLLRSKKIEKITTQESCVLLLLKMDSMVECEKTIVAILRKKNTVESSSVQFTTQNIYTYNI